jgi:acetyl-CoA/propionyl-CoA carboxylase carboxyl transferase subunit
VSSNRAYRPHLEALVLTATPTSCTQPSFDAVAPVDNRDPEVRLRALFDSRTLRLMAPRDDSGVLWAHGQIDGAAAVAFATDAANTEGALGTDGCRHIIDAINTAAQERVPVVGLWHSAGARLAEGVVALDAVGQVFAATVRASGWIRSAR